MNIAYINQAANSFLEIKNINTIGKSIWEVGISSELLVTLTHNYSKKEIRLIKNEKNYILRCNSFEYNTNFSGWIWSIDFFSIDDDIKIKNVINSASEQELNAIIESVSDGIYVTDGKGKTLRVNSAFEQITGIKSRDVVGKNVDKLVEKDIFRKSVTLSVLEEKRQISMVEELKIGKEVLLTGIPVYDDKGNIFRVVTTLRDIKGLNTLKKQLAEFQVKNQLYKKEVSYLRFRQMNMDDVVISSPIMQEVVETAIRVSEVNSNVLITGESGVGKEIISRIIHKSGLGEDAPLITCNCSAIPESLIESELFGYVGGAFTGARKEGSLECLS